METAGDLRLSFLKENISVFLSEAPTIWKEPRDEPQSIRRLD